MTAPAMVFDADVCPACRTRPSGLCEKEQCRKAVLPQLAKNVGWLKLIGEALVEQTKRQKPIAPRERAAIDRIGRRNARKTARAGRGYFGLARAIATAK